MLTMWRNRPVVVAAISAGLVGLAFAPFNLFLLVFVCLVPWLRAVRRSEGKKLFRLGYQFGFVFYAIQCIWVVTFVSKWTGSIILAAIPWLAMCALGAVYYGLTAIAIHRCYDRGYPMLIPFVWAGMEVLRSYIPGLAFPWGLISTPLVSIPDFIASAYLGGAFLISAWVVLANVMVEDAWGKLEGAPTFDRRSIMAGIIGIVGLLTLSLTRPWPVNPGKQLRVAACQPGIDLSYTAPQAVAARMPGTVKDLLREAVARQADLAVFPEGIGHIPLGATSPVIHGEPLAPPLPTLIGVTRRVGDATRQSAAMLADGQWTTADKNQLVIFGEYVPFRDQLPFLKSFNLPNGDLEPGTEVKVFKLNDTIIGPLICFEALFPRSADALVAKGAQVIAVMSIDDWYRGTNAIEQLAQATRMRAIETGLPVVRVSSTGLSFFADHMGRIIKPIEPGDGPLTQITTLTTMNAGPTHTRLAFMVGSLIVWIVALIYLPKRRF